MNRLFAFVRRRQLLSGLVTLIVIALAVLIVAVIANAPQTSAVRVAACVESTAGDCIRFPSVTGTNLLGEVFVLPDGFTGDYNLILLSFDEGQTARMAAWLPVARELAAADPRFAYYSLPALKSVNPLVRAAIVGGMIVLIPDESVRALTIMLFLEDKDAFLAALAIETLDAPQALLLNPSGEIVWRATGDYSDSAAHDLRRAVEDFLRP